MDMPERAEVRWNEIMYAMLCVFAKHSEMLAICI